MPAPDAIYVQRYHAIVLDSYIQGMPPSTTYCKNLMASAFRSSLRQDIHTCNDSWRTLDEDAVVLCPMRTAVCNSVCCRVGIQIPITMIAPCMYQSPLVSMHMSACWYKAVKDKHLLYVPIQLYRRYHRPFALPPAPALKGCGFYPSCSRPVSCPDQCQYKLQMLLLR